MTEHFASFLLLNFLNPEMRSEKRKPKVCFHMLMPMVTEPAWDRLSDINSTMLMRFRKCPCSLTWSREGLPVCVTERDSSIKTQFCVTVFIIETFPRENLCPTKLHASCEENPRREALWLISMLVCGFSSDVPDFDLSRILYVSAA